MRKQCALAAVALSVGCSTHEAPIDLGGGGRGEAPEFPADASTSELDATDPPEVDSFPCHILCGAIDLAACSAAPPHLECFASCEDGIAVCPEDVQALFDCLGDAPRFACDRSGGVVSVDCAGPYATVTACVNGP